MAYLYKIVHMGVFQMNSMMVQWHFFEYFFSKIFPLICTSRSKYGEKSHPQDMAKIGGWKEKVGTN